MVPFLGLFGGKEARKKRRAYNELESALLLIGDGRLPDTYNARTMIEWGEKARSENPDALLPAWFVGVGHYLIKDYKKSVECLEPLFEHPEHMRKLVSEMKELMTRMGGSFGPSVASLANRDWRDQLEMIAYVAFAGSLDEVGDYKRSYDLAREGLRRFPSQKMNFEGIMLYCSLMDPTVEPPSDDDQSVIARFEQSDQIESPGELLELAEDLFKRAVHSHYVSYDMVEEQIGRCIEFPEIEIDAKRILREMYGGRYYYAQAVEIAAQIARKTSDADDWRVLGALYMNKGDHESDALSAFESALEHDENLASAHFSIGELYALLAETEKAHHHFKRAREISPRWYGTEKKEYFQTLERGPRRMCPHCLGRGILLEGERIRGRCSSCNDGYLALKVTHDDIVLSS